ncbi:MULTISPECIES: type II toxin-antitoxin system prevent-host-death family antitoxin [Micromonospora]|uniref:type II toxin-antitoxin system prevent-host-death family antitoxin n=1 Tax=Micromonospora TaxID=1873 RepID=UPI000D47D95B|nr:MULTISPECIES: type II toxin-antitoxin system prevent-host-death family antitoxin [Micromonospora]MBP1781116.1 prevent-host-death family protein [Micromonospora sp. HB375]MBQ1061545.1 type II toxin-antitoxin system Phd/YefM family antitoxin [Micromonospora sp. C41]MDH6469269.1 prevent-host-death family protein [Micromonospora sp. H404/HB375]PPA60679.1 hypothetical protein BAW75_11325 [Micromonospora chalcea]
MLDDVFDDSQLRHGASNAVRELHKRSSEVTMHGRPSAVLVSVEDLKRLEERVAVLGDAGTLWRPADSTRNVPR